MDNLPVLLVYDDRNYNPDWHRHVRTAVRSIIVQGNSVAMVKSRTKGFYQFPGGGIDPGETHEQALIRETLEEVGLTVMSHTIRPLGIVKEVRASQFAAQTIFDQTSYYYFADAEDKVHEQVLEDYEKDLGYTLEWVDMDKARQFNLKLCRSHNYRSKFVLRDAEILGLLLKNTAPG